MSHSACVSNMLSSLDLTYRHFSKSFFERSKQSEASVEPLPLLHTIFVLKSFICNQYSTFFPLSGLYEEISMVSNCDIQLLTSDYVVRLLNKPYGNEVNLRRQNPPLKCC